MGRFYAASAVLKPAVTPDFRTTILSGICVLKMVRKDV